MLCLTTETKHLNQLNIIMVTITSPQWTKQIFFEPHNSKFILIHQNIASIFAKRDLLEITISELTKSNSQLDAICLSETFVKKGDEKNIKVFNYKLASSYCRDKKRGGTCILLKNGIVWRKINFLKRYLVRNFFECSSIELPAHNLIIFCIYNSHKRFGKRFLSILDSVLHDVSKLYKKKKNIITGDFNINILDNTSDSRYLKNLIQSYNLIQHKSTD